MVELLPPCKIALFGAVQPSAVQNGTVKHFCSRYAAQLSLSGKERNMRPRSHVFFSNTSLALGRSFFPLFAIAVIAGAMLWGPWVSLAVVVVAVSVALRLI